MRPNIRLSDLALQNRLEQEAAQRREGEFILVLTWLGLAVFVTALAFWPEIVGWL
jgi:hypothetical protein